MARPSLEAMDTFVHIVEAGSLTAAARQMGIAKSVVSDRLSALESALGVTVIRRSTRRLVLTEAGERFFDSARHLLQQVDEAADTAAAEAGKSGPLRGRLRIAAPVSFGTTHLGRLFMPFLQQHPDLQCQIELSDGITDLLAGHFDFAVRIGRLRDSSLLARRLGTLPRWICASPDYLAQHGKPLHPDELRDHAVIGYSHAGAASLWRFEGVGGKPYVAPTARPRVSANNGELVREAACAGLGLAVLPSFILAPALADGRLIRVLEGFSLASDGLHLVYPADRSLPRKTRAALDYLAEVLTACVTRADASA